MALINTQRKECPEADQQTQAIHELQQKFVDFDPAILQSCLFVVTYKEPQPSSKADDGRLVSSSISFGGSPGDLLKMVSALEESIRAHLEGQMRQ